MRAFGSTRGKETCCYNSHHPARGGIDKEGGNDASVECGWEDVAFKPVAISAKSARRSSWAFSSELSSDGWCPLGGGFSPRMWPRVNDKMGSSNEKILCSLYFLFKKYKPSRPKDFPSVMGCTIMLVGLAFNLMRHSSALR